MKVWIVSRGCPDEKYVTQGIFEFDQAKALKASGVEVYFVAVDLRSFRKKRNWGLHYFVKENIPVYIANIPLGPIGSWGLEHFGRMAFNRLAVEVQRKHGQPDIVHAHFADIAYWVTDYCKSHSVALVITEHSSKYSARVLPQSLIVKTRRLYRQAAQVICVSEALKRNIRDQVGIESICIPNIVDLSVFDLQHQGCQKEYFEFVSAGNLIEWKRMNLLIRSIARLNAHHVQARLVIFGDGPQRAELEELICLLGVETLVELRGMVDRKVMAEEYVYADAFVLASKSETFGLAYVEAMSAGLPVIATRNGGSDDYVREFNGIMVDVDDEEQLYAAMVSMIKHIDKYDSKRIKGYVMEKYSSEVVAKSIMKVYSQIYG